MAAHVSVETEIRHMIARLQKVLEAVEKQKDPNYRIYTCSVCGNQWDDEVNVTPTQCSACC